MDEPVKIGAVLKPFADYQRLASWREGQHVLGMTTSEGRATLGGDHFIAAATASAHLEANRERWVRVLASTARAFDSIAAKHKPSAFMDAADEAAALREIMAWIGGDNG